MAVDDILIVTVIVSAQAGIVKQIADMGINCIEKEFGTEIAQIVEGVTKITELFKSVEEKQAENYNKMFGAM